jgi:UDP-glucuronate decarboxylase
MLNGSKRVLVTGGAGFIGSHVCERLLNAGDHVVCVDNFITGSRSNISHLLSHSRFKFLAHDVTEPLSIEVDEIFNLACPASPLSYQRDAITTLKTSVLGALNMLELARRLSATILQASTSEIYGDPLCQPQPESYWGNVNPIGLRSCYDEGKRCAETLFFDYHRQHGVRIKVARIFNTYGPRMQCDDGRVVSNFVVQALKGEPITIYGDGSQTRSFCYVDDVVEALIMLMRTTGDTVGPVNIGEPAEMTIRELAREVASLVGSGVAQVYLPLPADDPRHRRPDIALAARILGWRPTTPLADGLTRTIAYFEAALTTSPPSADAAA